MNTDSESQTTGEQADLEHDRYGLFAVLAGLATLLLALVALAWMMRGDNGTLNVANVAAIFGVFAAPVVAIVSAWFGIRAASKSHAEAARAVKAANDVAVQAAGLVSPQQARDMNLGGLPTGK